MTQTINNGYVFVVKPWHMAVLIIVSFLGSTFAPSEHGGLDDSSGHANDIYLAYNGSNSSKASGYWDLSNVTIRCATLECDGVVQAHILQSDPAVTTAERAGWSNLTLPDGYFFMYDESGVACIGHTEDGEVKKWELWTSGDPEAPAEGLAVVVNGEVRMVRKVAG